MPYDCFFMTQELSINDIDRFKMVRNRMPHVKLIRLSEPYDLEYVYSKISMLANTEYYWIIDPDIVIDPAFDWNFKPDKWDNQIPHLWNNDMRLWRNDTLDGIKLLHRTHNTSDIESALYRLKGKYKEHNEYIFTYDMEDLLYDIVYISYKEIFADDNYNNLLKRFPHAKRIDGVKGIFEAHKKAAELAETSMFYVVDADAIITPEFKFDYFAPRWDEETVHVWHSRNPINDLEYGYGGVKLLPTDLLRNATKWNIDFTTSISDSFKLMPEVSNITMFNTDAFNTWKSAFRECTKLSSKIIKEQIDSDTEKRLNVWCDSTISNSKLYGEYAHDGAIAGREYGLNNKDNQENLNMINDFTWLKERFNEYYE
ncbi:hypothetical protein N9E09_01325 [bacterium]|jgi:hypothetical protein|nr:hypothetical protein [bacterium]